MSLTSAFNTAKGETKILGFDDEAEVVRFKELGNGSTAFMEQNNVAPVGYAAAAQAKLKQRDADAFIYDQARKLADKIRELEYDFGEALKALDQNILKLDTTISDRNQTLYDEINVLAGEKGDRIKVRDDCHSLGEQFEKNRRFSDEERLKADEILKARGYDPQNMGDDQRYKLLKRIEKEEADKIQTLQAAISGKRDQININTNFSQNVHDKRQELINRYNSLSEIEEVRKQQLQQLLEETRQLDEQVVLAISKGITDPNIILTVAKEFKDNEKLQEEIHDIADSKVDSEETQEVAQVSAEPIQKTSSAFKKRP